MKPLTYKQAIDQIESLEKEMNEKGLSLPIDLQTDLSLIRSDIWNIGQYKVIYPNSMRLKNRIAFVRARLRMGLYHKIYTKND